MTKDLQNQIAELNGVHKGLTHIVEYDAKTLLSGAVDFEASANGLETITDSFDIELTIPHMFPGRLPWAKEVGGRIGTDYEHLNPDGTLCLGVSIEQRRVFFEQPTLPRIRQSTANPLSIWVLLLEQAWLSSIR